MNTIEILNLLQKDQAVNQILVGVLSIDLLPNIIHFPAALVVNLDPSDQPGSHWVGLYFDKNKHCDYFDTFGRKPKKLKNYIIKNSRSYTYNNVQVQRFITSTCGQMCVYFLVWRARGISFKNIVKSMCSDEFVTGFINSLFKINTVVYNPKFLLKSINTTKYKKSTKKLKNG